MQPNLRMIAAFATLALACGGDSASAPVDYSGNWEGTSSAGGTVYPITFTVSGGRVTALSVGVGIFHFSSGNQGRNCSTTMTLSNAADISGSGFTAAVASTMGATTFTGSFSSGAEAVGTYEPFDIPDGCSGSPIVGLPRQSGGNWTATRQ